MTGAVPPVMSSSMDIQRRWNKAPLFALLILRKYEISAYIQLTCPIYMLELTSFVLSEINYTSKPYENHWFKLDLVFISFAGKCWHI